MSWYLGHPLMSQSAARSTFPWPLVLTGLVFGLTCPTEAEEITAYTEPYQDIDVAAAESGTLVRMQVKEGDEVAAGQVLGSLDDEVLKVSLLMAESAMTARGRHNSALAELRLHTERLQKLHELRERSHASQHEVDRTQAQQEIAAASLESVEDDLRMRTLERQRIEAQLRLRRVTSPINGVVTLISKDVGEFVSANDPVILKVVQLDPLLVILPVPMGMGRQLVVNHPVSLYVGENREPVTGLVEFVSPTADPQSSTVRVRVRVPNPEAKLPCGAICRMLPPGGSPDVARGSAARPRFPGTLGTREFGGQRDR